MGSISIRQTLGRVRRIMSPSNPNIRKHAKRVAQLTPFSFRYGRPFYRWLRFLREAHDWTTPQIEAWQLEQFRAIVAHAYHQTAGYRQLYDEAGVTPDDIRTKQDISRLPFVTKTMIRDNLPAFTVRTNDKQYVTTGGSTGIPFGFYTTRAESEREVAFFHPIWRDFGWRSGQVTAMLRGAFIGSEKRVWSYDPYWRSLDLSSYYLTTSTLPQYLQVLQRFRPPYLQAYASSLNILCDLLKENDLVRRLHFDIIVLASENIYDWQLDKFAECFPSTQFIAHYGQAERVILAPWCPHRRVYHILPLYGWTEILDPQDREVDANQTGELIGTSFHMRVTPFIRYRTMDHAVTGDDGCKSCGRPYRVIREILGRAHEFIVSRQQRFISMTAINMHDDTFDALRQFQFYQDQPGMVVLKCVPRRRLNDKMERELRSRLLEKLGPGFELKVVEVSEIPRTGAGKYRFLDQRLKVAYGDS